MERWSFWLSTAHCTPFLLQIFSSFLSYPMTPLRTTLPNGGTGSYPFYDYLSPAVWTLQISWLAERDFLFTTSGHTLGASEHSSNRSPQMADLLSSGSQTGDKTACSAHATVGLQSHKTQPIAFQFTSVKAAIDLVKSRRRFSRERPWLLF